MNTDEKKEPEVIKTASAPDKLNEPEKLAGETKTDPAAEKMEDQSQEQSGSANPTDAPEKGDEPEKQVEITATGAAQDKQDVAETQLAAVQPPAEPVKTNGVQKKVEPKKPEETLTDYLSKLNAIDAEATLIKDGSAKGQDSGAKTELAASVDKAFGYMDEVAKDVTPVTVTRACQKVDQGNLLGNQPLFRDFQKAEEILNDESKSFEEKISESKDILTRFCAFYNFSDHKIKAVFADYAIMIGKFLLAMKDFLHRARKKDKKIPIWGVWAEDNLSFIGERTRQNYMKAAARTDAINYSFFGLERLLHLIDATEHLTGPDPIGSFLRTNKISFDPGDDELKMHEFKVEVDVALAVEKARENKVNLDPAKVKELIVFGAEVDRKLIADCKQIADSGGDPNKYLDARINNKGKEVDYWVGEKILSNLIVLSKRLANGYQTLAGDPGNLMKLELSELEPLLTAIARLQEARNKLTPPPTGRGSTSGSEKE